MAREAFYFSHDYGSRNDPKLQKVLMKLGHEGKSVYWDLVEMMYEESGYLKINEIENYAFALRANSECIIKLISDFDLFKSDSENFWSESVLRRLDKRDAKSKKASESAKTRWDKANASKNDANASKNDAIKDSKGKDSKENLNIIPETETVSGDVPEVVLTPEVPPAKPKPKGKGTKKKSTAKPETQLFRNMVKFWFDDFRQKQYKFRAVDGAKIKSIIEHIEFKLKAGGKVPTDDLSLDFFRVVCQNLPPFYKNAELKDIDSNFNKILTEIKDKRNGQSSTKTQSAYDSAASVWRS